jgi:DNA-binding transcriptional LysR family regulator
MTDRFEDMRTFITVVQAKGFAGAGERLGVAKSAISRRVSDLEDRLGTRLLHRTTREVSLTESGADFYDRGIKLLADLEEAEDLASKGRSDPIGKLRVTAPVSFGIACMSPVLGEMSARYPRLSVQMEFLDRHTDLVREGFDVAVRISRMKDSSLIARRLAPIRHASAAALTISASTASQRSLLTSSITKACCTRTSILGRRGNSPEAIQ